MKLEKCKKCGFTFDITDEDNASYKKFDVPPPTHCPQCREQRRLSWRNESHLYRNKCARTGKEIISYISPDKPIKVYDFDLWMSDKWDARDYGMGFDFNRPFFEQFRKLLEKTPHIPLLIGECENCEYTNYSWCNKNCYMVLAADVNEDCFYSSHIWNCRDSSDCFFSDGCELCYECVDCDKCYNTNFSKQCKSCTDCYYCDDCIGCNDCIGCINLRSQKNCIFNEHLTKEEFEKEKTELLKNPQKITEEYEKLRLKEPIKAIHMSKCENSLGNNLNNCKNCYMCFDLIENEDCRYVTYGIKSKDCMDLNGAPSCELLYECVACPSCYSTKFSSSCWVNSSYLDYCHLCRASEHCFGCISLYRAKNCILNKQYTKEEYEKLLPKIIEHMKKTNEYGEFFPASISPFNYEETEAMDYYPKRD